MKHLQKTDFRMVLASLVIMSRSYIKRSLISSHVHIKSTQHFDTDPSELTVDPLPAVGGSIGAYIVSSVHLYI